MALNGPIVLVEDDENDIDVITAAVKAIGVENTIKSFKGAREALEYLLTTNEQPFFILCDIKMPVLDGLSFRRNIIEDKQLKKKAIPFLFFTGLVTQAIIDTAFIELDVQGFYRKEVGFENLKKQLLTICMYWRYSLHPNKQLE